MVNMSRKSPIIHIGMPKTATKTLQWRLFANHSQIYYLGRFDGRPFKGKYREFKACRDAEIFGIMDKIAYGSTLSPDLPKFNRLMNDYLYSHASSQLVPVWSWESYSTSHKLVRRSRAENLKAVFEEAKILITIRNPIKLLESAYMQQLRRDNIGARYRAYKPLFYKEIDQWVKDNSLNEVTHHLEYAEVIKLYSEIFGTQNIKVLIFEELIQDKHNFYEKLCQFMGIDLDESLELVANFHDNSRWQQTQINEMMSIHRSWTASLRYRLSNRRQRKEILHLDKQGNPSVAGEKANPRISEKLQDEIYQQVRSGHEWLDEQFDLGLKEYGYYHR